MPSRRFLAADLETYSRCSRENRSVSATICLVSMIARLPGIVTFRFRELLPSLHQLLHAKGCNLRVEPHWTLKRLLPNSYIFIRNRWRIILIDQWRTRNHAFRLINTLNHVIDPSLSIL